MIRILELFGGIGACSKALERLGIDYEIADYVEIDKYAVKSFNAMHETNFEPQDICEWDKDIEVDLIMHGSPCQDFSLAGKQAGGDKGSGTRSSLMYETIRIVDKLKPKYVIWENVKNLLSKKHIHNFNAYLERMDQLGYINYYQVLNAKDYGIPQNRERVFTISIRKDINKAFTFPQKQELKLKLKDMLEDEVDEKYYLSEEIINKIRYKFDDENVLVGGMQKNQSIKKDGICTTLTSSMGTGGGYVPMVSRKYGVFDTEKSKHQAGSVYDKNGLAPTLDTMQGGWRQPCIEIKEKTKQGYKIAYEGDGVNISSRMKYQRGNVQKESIQTLTTSGGNDRGVVVNDLRIRKLTPKECGRLMGFDDEDYERAAQVNSNTQLYKQAGNSIVVNVLEAILTKLLIDNSNQNVIKGQTTIFDYL